MLQGQRPHATTVNEGNEHCFRPASSAVTSPVVVDHSNIHSNIRGGFVDDTPRGHSSPVAEVQQTLAESPSTRVAVFVSCGVALLFLLRTTHLRRAAASNDRQMQNWREQDAGAIEPNASPAFAAAAVGAAGRVLPVEERQAKAKEDIAAAKARQAAFASQGSLQFTDVDIAKPDLPDISSDSESSPSSATATMALDDAQMPSASQPPGSGKRQPSSQPTQGSATGTFVLGKGESEESTGGSATETFDLGQADNQAEDNYPTDTFVLESGISQGSSGNSPGSSGRSRQPPVYDSDTSKPSYTQGRADLKPRVAAEHDARADAQAQLQKQQQQKQTLTSSPPVADSGRTASVYEPDTSKPLYAKGRADLKPHAADEQNARQAAQAELKAKSQQTTTSDVSAADAVKKVKAEQSAAEQSPAESDRGQSDSRKSAPKYEPDTSKPLYTRGRADLKPRAADEQNAQQAAQAELKAKSQQTSTPDVSAADAVRKLKAEQPPAESETGKADATPSAELAQTSPVQQSSSLSPASSKPVAGNRAPAGDNAAREKAMAELKAKSQQQQPNPLQGLLSAFQGLLGGQSTSTATPSTSSSGGSGVGAERVELVPLTAAQQAQLSPADASASQRMAASNQALAAGKGQPRTRTEVPVKRYTEVSLPGDVTEYVRARGLRAPLVLLAGLAASAAQTLEPLWSVESRGRKRQAYSEDEPLDWNRYRKYDVFNNLLSAAAASPAAQGEEFSPFRALANAVPQEGVPKYDFLRNILQGALSSPVSAPDTGLVQGFLRAPQRVTGKQSCPDGKAVRSKYDPFHTLLQRAQEDPSWPTEGPGFDPLAAAFQDASEPWYPLITKYDPFRALFNAQDPTGSSAPGLDPLGGLLQQVRQRKPPTKASKVKLDPFQSLFKDSGPSKETSPLDPVGNLLENARQPKQQSVDSKYDPFQALFNAEGPSSEASPLDPLGNLLQSMRQAKLRSPESNKYDAFQALFRAEGPSSETSRLDPLGNLLQSVQQSKQRSLDSSKYDAFQDLFKAEGPSSETSTLDPLGNLLQSVRQAKQRSPDSNKYDAFQDLFKTEGPSSETSTLDPLGNLLQSVRQGTQRAPDSSKYDAFQDLFKAEGPSSETSTLDPLGNLLQSVRQAKQRSPDSSKYDAFQDLFKAEGPSSETSTLDPLGNLLQNMRQAKQRSPDSSKYDAFQDLFKAEGPSSETSTLDPLGNLLQSVRQAKLQSPDSNKYDVFQALFNAEGPSSETAPLDPVGNLLQNVSQPRPTPVKSKYDPFQAIFDAPGPSEQAPALDPLGALLEGARKPWTSVTSKYDPFQAMFRAEGASGDAQLDPLPHVIRGLKARAQLALHRKGAGPGAATTRLDKYDLVYQILSSQPASGAVPGFDPVGSLLKSSWLKEPSTQQKQLARDRRSVSKQAAAPSQAGRALGSEHEARQQAQNDFMRRGRQPAAASGFEAQTEGPQEADRPSEWAGFIYNPYSGDLLPPEDDENDDEEGELQDVGVQGGIDMGVAYKGQRSGAGGGTGSGKPQFVSTNAFRGPSSRRPTQVQALGTTAAMAAVAPSNAEAAPLADASQVPLDAMAVLMHLGCMVQVA
ncbi:MAG: hypothetical protein FRX49_10557 [Trebouxia sp. A1-2]|nr:MAG: hypothetical protein FRX49_10557 [Trebouxia sp. A1-2]